MNKFSKYAAIFSMLFAITSLPSTANAGEVYISVPQIVIGIGNHYDHDRKYVKKKYYNSYGNKSYYKKNNYYSKSYRKGYSNGYSKGYSKSYNNGYKKSQKSKRYYRGY